MIQQLNAVPEWDRDMIVSVGSMMEVPADDLQTYIGKAQELCENVTKVLETYNAIVRLAPSVSDWEDPTTKKVYVSIYARLTRGCAEELANAKTYWRGVEIPGPFKFLIKPEGEPFVEI